MDTPSNGLSAYCRPDSKPCIEYRSKRVVITLGNPRQNCKYFGICRVNDVTTVPTRTELKPNQCVAEYTRLSAEQMTLEILFLKAFLNPKLLKEYFTPHFMVEAPYYFSNENRESLRSNLFCICEGHYSALPASGGLSVVFLVRY